MLSRVADSLYWMSRYLERAEYTARLLEVHLSMSLDTLPSAAPARWNRFLACLILDDLPNPPRETSDIIHYFTVDTSHQSSIASCVAMARENARQIRETISSEMFEQLNRLYFQVRELSTDEIWYPGPYNYLDSVKIGANVFHGVTDTTLNRDEGYHFIRMGRYLERGLLTIALLDAHRDLCEAVAEGSEQASTAATHLDWVSLLKCCSAFEAYCREYSVTLRLNRVLEFLLLHEEFPHSVRFAADRLSESLQIIGQEAPERDIAPVRRVAGRFQAELCYSDIDELLEDGFPDRLKKLQQQCERVHTRINEVFINYPIERELSV